MFKNKDQKYSFYKCNHFGYEVILGNLSDEEVDNINNIIDTYNDIIDENHDQNILVGKAKINMEVMDV